MWAWLASRSPIMLGLEPSLISKPRQFSSSISPPNFPGPDTDSDAAGFHNR